MKYNGSVQGSACIYLGRVIVNITAVNSTEPVVVSYDLSWIKEDGTVVTNNNYTVTAPATGKADGDHGSGVISITSFKVHGAYCK
jgi:hypothetical protein